MYRINENGAPEVFQAANGRQYMLPNTRGEVVSNRDSSAQYQVQPNIEIHLHEDPSRAGQVQQSRGGDGRTMINMWVDSLLG
ncbi:hypothetical protein AB1A87_22630, partial [Stenotrophomonas maltophilia]